MCDISIHAPLAGSDLFQTHIITLKSDFNPRSPCGERHIGHPYSLCLRLFQSTLPLRGATLYRADECVLHVFQSTLPLRGATPFPYAHQQERSNFNPRSPCGERRDGERWAAAQASISIHAPLAGSDSSNRPVSKRKGNFNPRSPCGERHGSAWWCTRSETFQSTLPLRGATSLVRTPETPLTISIHAPLAGSDRTAAGVR